MPLFDFAILYKPLRTKLELDAGAAQSESLIIEPKTIVAKNAAEASMKAARAIPEEYADKLDQIEVVVRPF